ncbi:hypothetical protein [Actinoplanes sp. NBRC 103695]|uniref:hypothetical protein n=1 Tax=Actinoplanes sp. NBRC 103695 TaxID=3032202 RepID=UPI002554CEF3|nr:hypothetical protein [Actinoplanes sp. NBRC 103695]
MFRHAKSSVEDQTLVASSEASNDAPTSATTDRSIEDRYYWRKLTDGKTTMEAMRALKRRLSDVVYRQMTADAKRLRTGPGGHMGATLQSSAADPNPKAGTSDKSLPGPAETTASNNRHDQLLT